ncbi:MAG TPA: VOC family protein, partial [Stellaceae bacterium]|nr:VOC family protein [Stellaceae bacterium]
MHGKFFWYDIMTADTRAAADFYQAVLGWNVEDSGVPGQEYRLFKVGDRPVAGLMPIPDTIKDSARPVWLGYVQVDDVDRAVADIMMAGGQVHRPPTDVPGVLRFAVVADPQGAVFLVATTLGQSAPDLPPGTLGAVGWHELYAESWSSVFPFYERLFGWTRTEALDMGPMGTYQLVATPGAVTESGSAVGMMNKPAEISRPYWGYYFNVDAIDAAAERVKAAGGTPMMAPEEVPGGLWILHAVDPQGAHFALLARQR